MFDRQVVILCDLRLVQPSLYYEPLYMVQEDTFSEASVDKERFLSGKKEKDKHCLIEWTTLINKINI